VAFSILPGNILLNPSEFLMNNRFTGLLLLFAALSVAAIEIDPTIAKKRLADELAWERRTLVEDYKTFGVRDPKWDADALAALEAFALSASDNGEGKSAVMYDVLLPGERAQRNGCSDPLLKYAHNAIRIGLSVGTPAQRYTVAVETAQAMRVSRCHIFRKAMVEASVAHTAAALSVNERTAASHGEFESSIDNARKLFTQCCADKEIPPDRIVDLGRMIVESASTGADREQALGWVLDGLTKEQRISGPILALAVSVYTSYAWDARGNGYANTVSDQGWALMEKRLKIAENCAEQAFIVDPYIRATPTRMIAVELGQNKGRKRLDVWFNRGVALNPNDYDLHSNYLYYLEPKWHGSEEQMLNFARVVGTQKNWKGGLPLLIEEAHRKLSAYEKDVAAYFQSPDVWKEIKASFEPFLQRYPNAVVERTHYMRLAVLANQIPLAKEQLLILKSNIYPRAFASNAEMQRIIALLSQP